MWVSYSENNCQELKKETEDKIQTLVADHKTKVTYSQRSFHKVIISCEDDKYLSYELLMHSCVFTCR